jgi:hypothetical protein
MIKNKKKIFQKIYFPLVKSFLHKPNLNTLTISYTGNKYEDVDPEIRLPIKPQSSHETSGQDPRSEFVIKKYNNNSFNDYPNQDTNRIELDFKKEHLNEDLKIKEEVYTSEEPDIKPQEPEYDTDLVWANPSSRKIGYERILEKENEYVANRMRIHNEEREKWLNNKI